ncbi:hypothetical protein [Empedobacter sedimenti]|uniref:hypothetical protein n=1 Tax=Empedobacter sedimenti TaxID=3042610 RepID=UPI0024A718C8|nr:hypothetical protein [Empedobacter sedimenti]
MNFPFRLLFTLLLLNSCIPKKSEAPIDFTLESDSNINLRDYGTPISTIPILSYPTSEDGSEVGIDAIAGISIEKAQQYLDQVISVDEVVLNDKKVQLIIDYPMKKPASFELVSEKGFTRRELILAIQEKYKQIYKEEEESAATKTIPMNSREGLSNRNETNGKYGIWGHDLIDLYLTDIEVYKDSKGVVSVILYIDS